jgi:hypothetical protein
MEPGGLRAKAQVLPHHRQGREATRTDSRQWQALARAMASLGVLEGGAATGTNTLGGAIA